VEDKNTRFKLAEGGNLDVAMEMAKAVDQPGCWERLAVPALKQGNHKVYNCLVVVLSRINITVYHRESLPADERLRSAVLTTGSMEKLSKMQVIADTRCLYLAQTLVNSLYNSHLHPRCICCACRLVPLHFCCRPFLNFSLAPGVASPKCLTLLSVVRHSGHSFPPTLYLQIRGPAVLRWSTL
jgi:hypothetical protein